MLHPVRSGRAGRARRERSVAQLADAAHLPQLEDPVGFADVVASFVAEIYGD